MCLFVLTISSALSTLLYRKPEGQHIAVNVGKQKYVWHLIKPVHADPTKTGFFLLTCSILLSFHRRICNNLSAGHGCLFHLFKTTNETQPNSKTIPKNQPSLYSGPNPCGNSSHGRLDLSKEGRFPSWWVGIFIFFIIQRSAITRCWLPKSRQCQSMLGIGWLVCPSCKA
jgi:hypothetical protein